MREATAAVRKRILEAALQTMSEVGYEGASTREIAARAGVAHPLMRYYFRRKEDLWFALIEDLIDEFNADLAKTLEGASGVTDPADTLRIVIDHMARMSVTAPGFHRITLLESIQNSPRLKWLMDEHFGELYRFLIKLIEEGQALGKVRKLDPLRLAYGIPTLIGGFILASHQLELLSGRDVLSPEEIDKTIAVVHAFVFEDPATS